LPDKAVRLVPRLIHPIGATFDSYAFCPGGVRPPPPREPQLLASLSQSDIVADHMVLHCLDLMQHHLVPARKKVLVFFYFVLQTI